MTSILSMSSKETRDFLLSPKNYCSIDLPIYINLKDVLAAAELATQKFESYRNNHPRVGDLDGVNHIILHNKDGAYAWRPFQLIHPVLYVELVNAITDSWKTIQDRFVEFQANDKISCRSIPVPKEGENTQKESSILNWWRGVEQDSILLSLKYKYLTTTDITDFYGALYTHTVAWALHSKDVAKKNRRDKDKLLGNKIDCLLQDMQNRQTNGIPQGSVISDLIAEMVLGYADMLLYDEINKKKITDYKILRYKDDYRIFTQTTEEARTILRLLTEVLSKLNFKLNTAKTNIGDDIITSSVKPDKLYWIGAVKYDRSLFKTLLIISDLGKKHPNTGSVDRALKDFRKRLDKVEKRPQNNDVLLSIVVDIMYKNPRVYPMVSSILSKLLSFETKKRATNYVDIISKKFKNLPNTGFLDIWLQRISIDYNRTIEYEEKLCQIVAGTSAKLWNSEWLTPDAKKAIESVSIVNEAEIKNLDKVIPLAETETFLQHYLDEPMNDFDEMDSEWLTYVR